MKCLRLLLIAAAVVVVAVGCSDPSEGGRRNVEIWDDEALLSSDGRSLTINFGTCNGDGEVEVVETDDEVRLTVESYVPGRLEGQDDCLDGAVVELNAPLGDRKVIDTVDGDELDIIRP